MELLYLQTTVQNSELRQLDFQKELSSLKEREFEHSKQLSEIQKMAADLQMSLAEIDGQNSDLENQNEDFRMSIASFENLKNSTFTTRVRSNPVILDKPVAPRPVLYTLLAANFGLLMSLIAAFLLEYIRAQKAAYRA
jgi:septal ring factor EnvC (AmiA/AmiB activator)